MGQAIAGDPNSFAGASEHSQQVALMAACAHYAKYFRDEAKRLESSGEDAAARSASRTATSLDWFHAIPNGGTRGGDKRSAMIAGANMKAEGAKSGVSDLHMPVARKGYHGFYIEMKAPGKLKGESAEQKEFGEFLTAEGYLYAVFDSWAKAMRAIMWYLDFAHSRPWRLPE